MSSGKKLTVDSRDLRTHTLRGGNGLRPRRPFSIPLRLLVVLLLVVLCFRAVAGAQQSRESADNLSRLRTAAEWIVKGDLKNAEEELQAVLSKDPNEYRALNLLGVVRAQQNRIAEAEQLFKQALNQNPEFVGPHLNLGLLYAETGRDEEAATQLERALTLEPSRQDVVAAIVRLWRTQAAAALKAGEMEKALSLLLKARKTSPRDPDVNYEFGMVSLRMSLFPDALHAFEDVLQVRKDDAYTVYAEGRAQMGLGKFQEARDLFSRYVELRPRDASGYYGLGLVLRALEQLPEARHEFERSIELQPVQTEAYVQIGQLDLEEGNLENATGRFQQVLQRDPRHSGALLGMGRVEFQRKQYESATGFLKRSIVADPDSREPHYYLGLAYARLGRAKESSDELALASRLEQEDLERQRVILKLLDPSELDSINPK